MKRPRDLFDTPTSSSPPRPSAKRRYLADAMASSSPSSSRSDYQQYTIPKPTRSRTTLRSSPWASVTPHDSPSNPFGLNRTLQALALPRPSGFAKHLVLRMQLVSSVEARTRSRRIAADAPYRIVQVPMNYSFRHLHMLILFLFASDARLRVQRRRRVFSPTTLFPRQIPPPRKLRTQPNVLGESPRKDEGHVFHVYQDVSLYSTSYRPGVIIPGSGKLYAKLSSKRDRKLFSNHNDDPDEEEDVFGSQPMNKPSSSQTTQDGEDEGWEWEPEDDLMVGNVWTNGPCLTKGIIYHHTPSTAIHITVNSGRVPSRKGTSNTPHVFTARGGTNGAVRIANVFSGPLPRDESSDEEGTNGPKSSKKWKSKKGGPIKDLIMSERDFDVAEDLDEGEDADEEQLERWNIDDAFRRFLKREARRERAMRRDAVMMSSGSPSKATATARYGRPSLLHPAAGPSHMFASRAGPSAARHYYAIPHAASSETSLTPSSPSTLPIAAPSSDFDGDREDDDDDDFFGVGCSAWSDSERGATSGTSESGSASASASNSGSGCVDDDEDEEDADALVYRIALPTTTPFPTHAGARRRLARACEHIERQTSKGLSELSDEEEEEEEEDVQAGDATKPASEDKTVTVSAKVKAQGKENAGAVEPPPPPPVVAADVRDPLVGLGALDMFEDEEERRQRMLLEDDSSDDDMWDHGVTWFGPPVDDWVDSEEEV